MTSPVTPPAAPTVPTYPALGSPTFNAEAYTYGSSMPGVSAGMGALADNAYTNATSAQESAVEAAASAVAAQTAAANSASSAHFKGNWASLTGPLAPPASAAYEGLVWTLTEAVADVTAVVPGLSPKWIALNGYLPLYPALVNSGGVYNLSVDGHYDFSVNAPQEPAAIARAPATPGEGAVRVITRGTFAVDTECRRVQFDPNGQTVEHYPSDVVELDQIGTYVWRFMDNTWRLLS
jgi:hypothetical protein